MDKVVNTEEVVESNGDIIRHDPLAEVFRKVHSSELGHLERKVEEARESPGIIRNRGPVCESHRSQNRDANDSGCVLDCAWRNIFMGSLVASGVENESEPPFLEFRALLFGPPK